MLLMKFAEFGWIGAPEMSVFHGLSAGNTEQAPVDGAGAGLGFEPGFGAAVTTERLVVVAVGGAAVVVVGATEVLVVDVLVVVALSADTRLVSAPEEHAVATSNTSAARRRMAGDRSFSVVEVVIAGAGIGGLTAAIGLARDGHEVTILERDDTPMPDNVEDAFAWDRRGAPQVRHTHGFPALIRRILRDRYPDVLDALRAAGVNEVSIAPAALTPDMPDYAEHFEDLHVLACRRTTLEWVLRRCALAEPNVAMRVGDETTGWTPGQVTVAATGRRSDIPAWFAAHGITIEETEHPTGTIYLSRFYRADGAAPMGYIGGRRAGLGFVIAGADNGTYSATLAVSADDAEMRAHLLDADRFEASLPLFREMKPVVERQGTPITDVQTMGGLINRIRRFTDADGEPLAPGFFAVGDAHTCTNPLYGRGSSLAVLQATLVVDALRAHPVDMTAASRAYEVASRELVEPWYEMSLLTDKPEAANLGAFDLQSMRRATASEDPEIAVLMTKMMSLLLTPNQLFGNPAIVARLEAAGAPKERVFDPNRRQLTREDILAAR